MTEIMNGGGSDPTELRRLISRGMVVTPGVFNGISALIAEAPALSISFSVLSTFSTSPKPVSTSTINGSEQDW